MIAPMPNPVNGPPTASAQLCKLELDILYQISHVLSRSFDLQKTLKEVLEVLDEQEESRRHSGSHDSHGGGRIFGQVAWC